MNSGKKIKINSTFNGLRIGTHSGAFHVDEVLACVMLRKYTKQFFNASVTRTRDQKLLDEMDIVVDVGGKYEPECHRYDHHQKEFQGSLNEQHTIRLSSAGLIYKHFGKEVIRNLSDEIIQQANLPAKIDLNENIIDQIYDKVYENFVKSIDAIDNGINQYQTKEQPLYHVSSGLGNRVGRLNPMWTEQNVSPDERFEQAMVIADLELREQIRSIVLNWLPARPLAEEAFKNRFDIHESGQILKIQSCPWKEHVMDIERENKCEGSIKYCIYPDGLGGEGWRIQCVPVSLTSFENRKSLHQDWRGIKDVEQLRLISGIHDMVFCHASGFIGGAQSFESCLKMGLLSLNS